MELPLILVVEDDQLIQSLVEDTFRDGGFDIAIVASGHPGASLGDLLK